MEVERRRGVVGDIQRLKDSGGASAAELREFVHGIKGRSPKEMLGVVAQSSLLQSTLTATIGCVVLMAIFTAGPYAWSKYFPAGPAPAAAQAKAAAPAADASKANPAQPATAAANPAPGAAPAAGNSGDPGPGTPRTTKSDDDLLNKLGVGETKTSDPNANPLDNDKDDLLKEVK